MCVRDKGQCLINQITEASHVFKLIISRGGTQVSGLRCHEGTLELHEYLLSSFVASMCEGQRELCPAISDVQY